jgi:hypothetical protein
VVFDEAESNEKGDQQRMQAILSLARVASSESSAEMLKGSPSGDVSRYRVRSMFLMSSIATALKQGADKSRFAQLTLRSPPEMGKEERESHWQSLDRDLEHHVTPELARRLIARTVSLIPVIRQAVVVFSAAAARAGAGALEWRAAGPPRQIPGQRGPTRRWLGRRAADVARQLGRR